MTHYMPRQPEKYAFDPPDESVLYPGDKQQLSQTSDYLFLAAVLKNWDDPAGLLSVYGKPEPLCVFKSPDNVFRHPVSGNMMDDPGRAPLFQLKRKTVAGYFRKEYFMIRRILASTNLHLYGQRVTVGGQFILKEVVEDSGPEWMRYGRSHESTFQLCVESLSGLNLSLKYKLEDESFKNNFRTMIRTDLNTLKAGKGRAVCPFDGVVVPIAAEISSALWTWNGLCGREYTGLLCPHCLGVVKPFTLARMS